MSTKRPASPRRPPFAATPDGCGRPALAPLEIAVRGRGAALARAELIRVHAEAHRAAGLAPFEAGLLEDPVEPLGLGLRLHQARARHDHGADALVHLAALDDLRHGAQILDAAIGAGADEDAVERDVGDLLAALQPHIIERALGGLALASRRRSRPAPARGPRPRPPPRGWCPRRRSAAARSPSDATMRSK